MPAARRASQIFCAASTSCEAQLRKTACEIPLNVRSHPQPYPASPYAPEWSRTPSGIATRLGFRAQSVRFRAAFACNWRTAPLARIRTLAVLRGSAERSGRARHVNASQAVGTRVSLNFQRNLPFSRTAAALPCTHVKQQQQSGSRDDVVSGVDDWRGVGRCLSTVAAPFVWRCRNRGTVNPFPVAAHR